MKVAITSTGNTLESSMGKHLGRCAFFAIYDTDTSSVHFIANPGNSMREGAGYAAVTLVISHGVEKIISGEFGYKLKASLDSHHIQMVVLEKPEMTIREIINLLEKRR